MTISKIPVWLDCDPGHDDMIAILLTAFHPNFNLLGISTTFGNSSLTNTTRNTLSILTIFQKLNIPVFKGSSKPVIKEAKYAPSIHGESGLAGTELPTPVIDISNPNDTDDELTTFYNTLKKEIDQHIGEISIVATGPLTNIGKFFLENPEYKSKVKFISIMGGGIEISNWGAGEFNTLCDPHATNYIFQDSILSPKTILLPIDVTHTAILNSKVEKQLQSTSSNLRKFLYELMEFFKETYKSQQAFIEGPPIHDPLAAIVLLEEYGFVDLGIESIRYNLTAVENGELEGKLNYFNDSNGVKVVTKLNIDKFWEIVLETVDIADQ
ncbi:Pyrimidine-specific ribonucleoside hydrolase [Wickerhamomyces ciferrii]|uniref:Pyrimidine-specific ribonucleoside hydrolase n=1 Tax=Wickerhamomyces ciferrii (strain ATCC 14091 / BCRC 22168 / CBS 111 / JCM 3599 / NBRC 0793 / NRRL Y-1031 F-60-10) TaxID=1206466 RepID=K0KQU4_WICCF|nr:Pyrimidine-specific ribonucleoside hydrolase [Wickerhamomyces ciferrii]CCH43694.1 Pyrimidine-specific ribonucleoside hydrolase [Wickerhamomyces ciferrii]